MCGLGLFKAQFLDPSHLWYTYINDLSDRLSWNLKSFTDVTSHVWVVKNHTQSGIDLNSELRNQTYISGETELQPWSNQTSSEINIFCKSQTTNSPLLF